MLWCDHSSVTEIPHPETIHGYSPAGYAEAIFMNDSCLQRISTGKSKKKQISKIKVGVVRKIIFDKSEHFVVWCPVPTTLCALIQYSKVLILCTHK